MHITFFPCQRDMRCKRKEFFYNYWNINVLLLCIESWPFNTARSDTTDIPCQLLYSIPIHKIGMDVCCLSLLLEGKANTSIQIVKRQQRLCLFLFSVSPFFERVHRRLVIFRKTIKIIKKIWMI